MFRRALVFSLAALSVLAIVADANACHRCRSGYGYGRHGSPIYGPGCGYYCHKRMPHGYGGYGYGGCGCGSPGYRVVRVWKTTQVPVKTCTTTCVKTVDPCNPCCVRYTPASVCSTTYVTTRTLVRSYKVPYGAKINYVRRPAGVAAYGKPYGYSAPYRYGAGNAFGMDNAKDEASEPVAYLAGEKAEKVAVAF